MKKEWQSKPLVSLCRIELGKTPFRANSAYWDEERKTRNVWLSIADLLHCKNSIVSDSKEYISDKGASISKIVPKGTLLVSFKLTLGRLAYAGRDLYTNEAIAAIRDLNEKEVSKEYLYYFLTFFDWDKYAETDIKLKGKTLNKAKLKEIQISFPPLPEQKRIVKILDEAFAGIAIAKANAEKNLLNARALFESYLNDVFTKRGEGWEEKPLFSVCEVFDDGDWIESKDQSPSGIRLIQTGNIGIGEFKNRERKARYISEKTFERLRCNEVFIGDCLISRLPDPVGRSCIVPKTGERMITAVDCTIVRFNQKRVLPAYFTYYSQSNEYIHSIDVETTGTTRNRISRNKLGQVYIPMAPIDEQKKIIGKLDEISEETKELESVCQRKLDTLEDLKKSLLHQAFQGEL